MTKEQIREQLEKIVAEHVGDLDKLSGDKEANDRMRSLLFVDFYEQLVGVFQRNFNPVVQLELVEAKELNLTQQ